MLEQFLDNFTNSRVPTVLFENVTVTMSPTETGFSGRTLLATLESNEEATKFYNELCDYIDNHVPVVAAPTLAITHGETVSQKTYLNFVSKYDAVGFYYLSPVGGTSVAVRGYVSFNDNAIYLDISVLSID